MKFAGLPGWQFKMLVSVLILSVLIFVGQSIAKSEINRLHAIMKKIKSFLDIVKKNIEQDKWDFMDKFDEIFEFVKNDMKQFNPPAGFSNALAIYTKGRGMLKKDLLRLKRLATNKRSDSLQKLLKKRLNLQKGSCLYCHNQLEIDLKKKIWKTK